MSEDFRQEPPSLDDPEEAAAAQEILSRPHGVPRGHTDVSDAKPAHSERLSPQPTSLDRDKAWFFLGLSYSMIGVDKSLFELYSNHIEQPVEVTTYRSDKMVADFYGADISDNAWFYTIQGIDKDHSEPFIDYISSFSFRDNEKQVEWAAVFSPLRLRDPFGGEGVWVNLLLPECLTSRRKVAVITAPDLELTTPLLGVQVVK